MKQLWNSLIGLAVLSVLLIIPGKVDARTRLADTLVSNPSACPATGCAAGQRLNINASVVINSSTSGDPNTQVCLYAPASGGDSNPWIDPTGFSSVTPSGYSAGETVNLCTNNVPTGYSLIYSAFGQRSTGTDAFEFALRINKTTTITGDIRLFSFQYDGSAWQALPTVTTLTYPVSSANAFSYVASSAANCIGYQPCYLNSGDDLANGIGTGLKDAVDASPTDGTITILGAYNIKGNSVTLSNPQTLRGINDSSLGYSGTTCANAMLLITGGATVKELNITDGTCTSPSRDLILINSASDVTLEYNNLLNGKDAISILDNTGNVSVRFNHITGNAGYGILRASGTGIGTVKAVANNIYSNLGSYQARCNNKGEVNYNFWGVGVPLSNAISTCTYTNGKQLGAAVLERVDKPGIGAESFSVKASPQTSTVGAISISGTFGVELVVANHGSGMDESIPFYSTGAGKIYACNDIFDVFISDKNTVSPVSLNITIPYNVVAGCETIIESTPFNYCSSLNSADFPLWWYDPKSSITSSWDTTGQSPTGTGASGQSGQTTTCDMSGNTVSVTLDTSAGKRPNLVSDLNFTPFAVGYQNSNVLFSSLTAVAGVGNIELSWETTKETGLTGYYVTRSTDPFGSFNRDSDLIPAKGDDTIGGIYQYGDPGLNHGTTYWYKLEMIFADPSLNDFYGPVSATTYGMIPTATDVTPNGVEVYGTSIAIKVKGNNFIPSSQVVWDNNLSIDLTTSYISSTELTAIIPGSLYDDPNSSALHNITVYNPGSGGGFSPPLTFTIRNPVPTLTSITPDYSDGNQTTITLAVKGENFVTDSSVRFNGSPTNITTTFIDPNNLTASVLRSKLSAGVITVTVFNPAYGGGTSAGKSFNLYTPTPTLTKVPTAYRTNTQPYQSYRSPTPQRTRTRTPTRTITGTIFITPSVTPGLLTPSLTIETTPGSTSTEQSTPEPFTRTPTLAPGEPTYTPTQPTPEVENPPSVWSWRVLSILRVLAGSLAGVGVLSLPAFVIFRIKTKSKPTH